jgi:GNAT superfamily N-acetyltransferase
MTDATFRIASSTEHPQVEAAYAAWGYHGGVAPGDVVYIAERHGAFLGAVRRTLEHEVTMLRGMYIAPAEQRRGLGSQLLSAFVADLHDVECYCVPYSHLCTFYARAGFEPLTDTGVPKFLCERLIAYRARGLDVLVMRRPVISSVVAPKRPNQAMQPTAGRRTASLFDD